jgi:hypothetical protein
MSKGNTKVNNEVSEVTAQIGVPTGQMPGPKLRLLTLADLDGRTHAMKLAVTLIREITGDLGGQDQLSIAEQQIVQRAALLGVIAEDIEARWLAGEYVDPTTLATIANAQRRLFEAIGLRRRPKEVTPTLSEYLASKERT